MAPNPHAKRFDADAKRFDADAKPASRPPETFREQITIPVPPLDFAACPEGDERMVGIAKLHALYDAR
jgi:hypothetical protein